MARVSTFRNEQMDERGEIVHAFSDGNLFKVKFDDGIVVIRHRHRMQPLDDEAKKMLGKTDWNFQK